MMKKRFYILFLSVLSLACISSCTKDMPVDEVVLQEQPVPDNMDHVNVELYDAQVKTKSAADWTDISEPSNDSLSFGIRRLVEPMDDVIVPETKGGAFLTAVPNDLFIDIHNVSSNSHSHDHLIKNGSTWSSTEVYFLDPANEYRLYVNNFCGDIGGLSKSFTPSTSLTSPNGSSYTAYTRDDIAGYYNKPANNSGTNYSVAMHHIYAALLFRFNGVGPNGAVIQQINIKNVKMSGTMSYNASGVSWTASGSTSNLTNTVNYTITNGTAYDFSSIGPLYVPASAVTSSTQLEVVLSYAGQSFTFTRSLSSESWAAGYKYLYSFDFNGTGVVTYQYRLVLEPESLTIPIGRTGTFVAKLHTDKYVNGSLAQTDYNIETIPASSIDWTFGDTNNNYVGMSSGSLTFTGHNVGSCNLQAFYNDSTRGISVADTSNPVTVVPAYRSVITPSSRTAMVNDVVRYDCYLQKQTTINGSWSNVTSGVTYSWSSRNTTYAIVSGSATSQYAYFRALQANAANTSTIIDCTCTYENVAYPASTAQLLITPEYSLSVSPSSATIPVGSYRSYTATLQKRSSSSASWTTITSGITGWSWYSSNTSVASISSSTSSATARGLSSGYTYITATCTVDGISVWSDSYASVLNVEDNYHLEVTPYSQSVGVGDTCYFTAELYNGTNYVADVTSSATWSFVSPSNASSYVINNTGGSFTGKVEYGSTITVQASYNYNGENLSGTGYITSVTSTTATFYRIVFSTSDSSVYYSDQYFSGFYVRKGGYGYLTPMLQQRTMVRTWQSGNTFTWAPASGSAGNWANSSTSISRSNCTWSTANSNIAWFTTGTPGRINGSSSLSSYPANTTFRAVYNGTSIGNSGKNPDGTNIMSEDTDIYVLRKGGSGNDNGENGS